MTELPTCGIVMPISAIDGCDETHWLEVRDILGTSIDLAGFRPNLVSLGDDVSVIHKRIVQNLYENPLVVCDVSGKNPNVMFELGMRLAFDRPTIVIKDDRTTYSFDTSPIEHITYPRDLRYPAMVAFGKELTAKVQATAKRAADDPTYSTFLKHFGEFKAPKIETREVSGMEYVLDELKTMRKTVERLAQSGSVGVNLATFGLLTNRENSVELAGWSEEDAGILLDELRRKFPDIRYKIIPGDDGPTIRLRSLEQGTDIDQATKYAKSHSFRRGTPTLGQSFAKS